MIKLSAIKPGDKFVKDNPYEELYLYLDEYLKKQGDSFSCLIEDGSTSGARGAAYKYAEQNGYEISVKITGDKVYFERTSPDAPSPLAKEILVELKAHRNGNSSPADDIRNVKWKSHLQEIELLKVDGSELHCITNEPEKLVQAIGNYQGRELREANYRFRTRIHGNSVFVRKVKS